MSLLAHSQTTHSALVGLSAPLSPQLAHLASLCVLWSWSPRLACCGWGRREKVTRDRYASRVGQDFPLQPPKPQTVYFLLVPDEMVTTCYSGLKVLGQGHGDRYPTVLHGDLMGPGTDMVTLA